jgi:UDP-glucose 4-epimerase
LISWESTCVLVTGGAGFIGSHLVEQLVAAGASVTVLDKLTTGSSGNLDKVSGQVRLIKDDIQTVDWSKLLTEKDYQVFFHLVGNAYVPFSVENPDLDYRLNLGTTFQILEALRLSKWPGKFIFPSSAAVYGNPVRMPIREEDVTVPISPYGASKLAAERYIQVYCNLYGICAASLRMFSVYGPRQRKLVVYDLIRKILENPQEIELFGDGSQVRDFIS